MSYQALYRKYRSQTFGDLVGQEHVVRSLQNAIERGKYAHAYLFTGPRGTGKTSTARLLAKALNCTGGPSATPPDDCPICAEITAGSCLDVIEMDAASESGVDDIREAIVESIEYKPTHCRFKIFIIDEVHDLSRQAFDALLKTIEEPPPHVIFILATTELTKVPPTIRSRCQRYEFHRGTVRELVSRIAYVCQQEGIEAEPAALHTIARMADGGYRDALTLLEQVLLNCEGLLTASDVYDQLGMVSDEAVDGILSSIISGEIKPLITSIDAIYRAGRDPRAIAEALTMRLADLTRAVYEVTGGADATVDAASAALATRFGHERILGLRGAVAKIQSDIRDITIPRQWLEAELIRVSRNINAPAVQVQVTPASAPSQTGTPAPARNRPEPATPRSAAASPAPVPKVETQHTTAVATPRPTRQPSLDDLPENEVWLKIAGTISAKSKSSEQKLKGSRVSQVDGQRVTVEFPLNTVADWVTRNLPLQGEICKQWQAATGWVPILQIVGGGGTSESAPAVETVAVELTYEGERLVEQIHDVFGTSPTQTRPPG